MYEIFQRLGSVGGYVEVFAVAVVLFVHEAESFEGFHDGHGVLFCSGNVVVFEVVKAVGDVVGGVSVFGVGEPEKNKEMRVCEVRDLFVEDVSCVSHSSVCDVPIEVTLL